MIKPDKVDPKIPLPEHHESRAEKILNLGFYLKDAASADGLVSFGYEERFNKYREVLEILFDTGVRYTLKAFPPSTLIQVEIKIPWGGDSIILECHIDT